MSLEKIRCFSFEELADLIMKRVVETLTSVSIYSEHYWRLSRPLSRPPYHEARRTGELYRKDRKTLQEYYLTTFVMVEIIKDGSPLLIGYINTVPIFTIDFPRLREHHLDKVIERAIFYLMESLHTTFRSILERARTCYLATVEEHEEVYQISSEFMERSEGDRKDDKLPIS